MAFDRADLARATEARRAARESERAPQISVIRQAGVAMELLLGNEQWDAYLKFLSARKKETADALASVAESIAAPTLANYEEIVKLKLRQSLLMGVLAGFEEAMTLPKQIIEAAGGRVDG